MPDTSTLTEADIRRLAESQGPPRSWLSVYLPRDWDREWFEDRVDALARDLEGETERENLEASVAMVRQHLEARPVGHGSDGSQGRAVFACWLDDALESFDLRAPVEPRLVLEASPFVMPLAELLDDWETYCVTYLDHDSARIFEVAGHQIAQRAAAEGDIKQHVKKGGWSQQRYERRRDKEIHHYCEEVADRIAALERSTGFDRLLLAGNDRLVAELQRHLPESLQDAVIGTASLSDELTDAQLRDAMEPMFVAAERQSERALFEQIRDQRYREGRAAIGPGEVLQALERGRVQILLVDRTWSADGYRCDACGRRGIGSAPECPFCESSLRAVGYPEEMVEMAHRTDAEVEVADPFDGLKEWGGVAALLRY